MQKTNFTIEIIIGNDCSTDETLKQVEPYALEYPDLIKVINTSKNVGAHGNMVNTLNHCRGKYIALCEGDDFWIDEYKLQKQVDFLNRNSDYVICCHYIRVVTANNELLYMNPRPVPLEYTYFDLLAGKQEETKTSSVVYRNGADVHGLFSNTGFLTAMLAIRCLSFLLPSKLKKKYT